MATISEFKDLFGQWIAAVAGVVDTVAARIMRPRRIELREGDDGTLVAKAMRGGIFPCCPRFRSVWTRAGRIRRCRRSGRRPFAAAASRCWCHPLLSCSARSIFRARPAVFSMA